MFWLLDRATQLTNLKRETPCPEPLRREAALKTTALAATLLLAHGQTTERTVTAAERLGRALGVTVKVLLAFPLISVAGTNAATGALAACMLVSVLVTPIADRLHLPFAALAFSAVVSLMPGFFLFNAATGVVELVSIGPNAPAALLTSIAANGATAFLIIMAMTFGLILPRMLFERILPTPA